MVQARCSFVCLLGHSRSCHFADMAQGLPHQRACHGKTSRHPPVPDCGQSAAQCRRSGEWSVGIPPEAGKIRSFTVAPLAVLTRTGGVRLTCQPGGLLRSTATLV